MKKSILLILVSIFTLSCSSDDNDSELANVETTLIAKDNLYGNGAEGINEQNMVITDQNAWNDLISQMDSVNTVSDHFSETDIDFSQYQIIAVFDELKANGGHSLELNIMANSENIIVNVTDIVPEGNATTVITQPFHIVKILNSDLPILFE
uniref:protease complex subunit PrcB family protein n=1 Tax=Gelidibacter sp. TaxID=2018083 RepID=UPI004048F7A1